MGDDLTLEVLRQIRDELKSHGAKLDLTNERLDKTNERLDKSNERLDRVVHEQIRHATAIVDLEARMGELAAGQREIVSELQGLNRRVDNVLTGPVGSTVRDTAARVDKLESRVDALESRSG